MSMYPSSSVLGCAGLCWVGFLKSAQVEAAPGGRFGPACWVCWVSSRVRMCVCNLVALGLVGVFILMREKQPSTLSTLSTYGLKVLFLLVFICAGFVLGWALSVLGLVLGVLA